MNFTEIHESIGDAETVAILAAVGVIAYVVYKLVQTFPQLKTGQVAPKPAPLAQAYPSTDSSVPLNLGPFTLGQKVTAQQYESGLESVPVIGNGLAQEFSAAYGAGAQTGNGIKSLLKWSPPPQLTMLSQELSAWSANIVANKMAATAFSSDPPTTVGQVRAIMNGLPVPTGGH